MSASMIRRTAVLVCAGGIAGMIASSALNHNGAAITFGLITAAAVLCSMVATAVAADMSRQVATAAGATAATTAANATAATTAAGARAGATPLAQRADDEELMGHQPGTTVVPPALDEEQAALVEDLIRQLVHAGSEEAAVRELARQCVRLGRGSSVP